MPGSHSNCTTEPDTFRRVEVISGVVRRRRWPRAEKARMVTESYAPGASATAVAARHGLDRNQIFAWRRRAQPLGADRPRNAGVCPDEAGVPAASGSAMAVGSKIEVIAAGIMIRLASTFLPSCATVIPAPIVVGDNYGTGVQTTG